MIEDLHDYSDIIYCERPDFNFCKMTIKQRAAQFVPFSALKGYDDEIKEKERETNEKLSLDNDVGVLIEYKLQEIMKVIDEYPFIKVKYFVEDKIKTGGKYLEYEGELRNIDVISRKILFISGKIISVDDIISLDY